MRLNEKVILFFLPNGDSSPEIRNKARELVKLAPENETYTVRFRNGSAPGEGAPETCDFVAGDPIPENYAARFPTLGDDGSVAEPFAPRPDLDANSQKRDVSERQAEAKETKEDEALREEVGNASSWG